MEMRPWFIVSSERLEKPGIKLTTPGLQGQYLILYTTETSILMINSTPITFAIWVIFVKIILKTADLFPGKSNDNDEIKNNYIEGPGSATIK